MKKKIKFIYIVFVSQNLPENYITPIRVTFGPVSLSENIGNLPNGDMEGIEGMEGLGDFEGMEGIEGGQIGEGSIEVGVQLDFLNEGEGRDAFCFFKKILSL